MALSKEELIEEIKQMSVLDLAEVVKALEEEFGVSAAAPVAVAAPAGGGDAGGADAGGGEEGGADLTDEPIDFEAGEEPEASIGVPDSAT